MSKLSKNISKIILSSCIASTNVYALQTEMPVNFQQSNFGWRFMAQADYVNNTSCGGTYNIYHPAADLNAVNDSLGNVEVHAIADGKIVINSNSWVGIVIKHTDEETGNTYYSQYGHIYHLDDESDLEGGEDGDDVSRGDLIGYIGDIGSTGVHHLHFSVRSPNEHATNDPEIATNWWGGCGEHIDTQEEVFTRYEDPLAFIRERMDATTRTIIIDNSVTYPTIGDDIDANNRVINTNGEIIKQRFFKSHNLNSWNTYVAGTGENRGFNGNFHYSSTENTTADAYGKWFFDIPDTGEYEVFANIPARHATSERAEYEINHDGGNSEYVTINQNEITGNLDDRWVSLGTYHFQEGNDQYVKLANNTGEQRKELGYDAIKLTQISSGENEPSIEDKSNVIFDSIEGRYSQWFPPTQNTITYKNNGVDTFYRYYPGTDSVLWSWMDGNLYYRIQGSSYKNAGTISDWYNSIR